MELPLRIIRALARTVRHCHPLTDIITPIGCCHTPLRCNDKLQYYLTLQLTLKMEDLVFF